MSKKIDDIAQCSVQCKSGEKMYKLVQKFVADDSGATAIEYGLIAALVAVAIIVGAGNLGTSINAKFANVATRVNNAG